MVATGEWIVTEDGSIARMLDSETPLIFFQPLPPCGADENLDLATFIVKCLNAREDGSDVADDREG